MNKSKIQQRNRRHTRIRAKVSGTADKPRLAVYKSNSNIIAQLIDDENGKTLAYVWTKSVAGKNLKEKSATAGKKIAELAKAQKISKAVFDRGGFIYTGNLKTLADAARDGGLKF